MQLAYQASIDPYILRCIRVPAQCVSFALDSNIDGLENVSLPEDWPRKFPYDARVRDATGRRHLQWAVARGNETTIITLLGYGADPNNMDEKLNKPSTLAATVRARVLLEAGAMPDPILSKGSRFGTPLDCAARNTPDPFLMRTLLDFKADTEACGVDGTTHSMHLVRGSSATHAMLLLSTAQTSTPPRGADTAAIQHNNHAVLKLLLAR